MSLYTQKVIYWLDYHEYSRMHWSDVAKEILAEVDYQLNEAIPKLAHSLHQFHITYQNAVVKKDNLLYDFIDICFEHVDWTEVAQSRYKFLDKS
jgi:hypothetical protein